VRKSGNALRITVQLVRAGTGHHVWSDTYDRKADDIFKIQGEIAAAVLQALRAFVLEESPHNQLGTQNSEAHDLFLQARAIHNRTPTQSEFKTIIDYLQRALRADPQYSQAWVALSEVLSEEAEEGFAPMDAVRRKEIRHAAERALELNPSLSNAHVAMARFLIVDELDLAGGEREVQRALELEPNNQWALAWAATLATGEGRIQRGTELSQKAVIIDPLNPFRHWDLAWKYYLSGNYPAALNAFRRVLDLNPGFSQKHLFPGQVLLAQGKSTSALAEINRESDEKIRRGCGCLVLALDGMSRKAQADSALAYLIKNHAEDAAYDIAVVFANRGSLQEAFKWFDRAYRQHDAGLLDVKVDPLLKNVQSDPRFAALLERMGLVK